MTVHIALANQDHAVLFSDSQGSTERSEFHGWHKQFVGKNFAVGVAGHGSILVRLIEHLATVFSLDSDFSISEVADSIREFVDREVRDSVRGTIGVLLVGFDTTGVLGVRQFNPGLFNSFNSPTNFGTIGSGSEYVANASKRNAVLGLALPVATLADMLVSTIHFADAANESLTVDDLLSVVLFVNGKTYLLGEPEVIVNHAHPNVRIQWNIIGPYWQNLKAQSDQIESEIREAARLFSGIRSGTFGATQFAAIDAGCQAIIKGRQTLEAAIDQYCQFYDGLVGR